MNPSADFLTIQEAARELRCDAKTIRRRIAARTLRAYRNGRRLLIPRAEIAGYLSERRVW